MILFVSLVILVILFLLFRAVWVAAGETPKGDRLERCMKSGHWRDGSFVNEEPTRMMTGDSNLFETFMAFLFKKEKGLSPSDFLLTYKTDFKYLERDEDLVVWLGHSSLFIQMNGKRFLFDPVLTNRLPVSLFMHPFKYSNVYTPKDIPAVDYLVITHDHWDHLDYETVKEIKDRVGTVYCPLGVGQHFEYWGYENEKICEMNWNDSVSLDSGLTLHCLPSRHFSGRLLARNKTLWASFLIDGKKRIFVSGDGGYDGRFRRFGERFKDIDLAIMENGQYDNNWKHIHTLPSELPKEIKELGAKRVMTYHNSKYALAHHRWKAPLDSIWYNAKKYDINLLVPSIGMPVELNNYVYFEKWW